ncbi:MAG: hypothetical protein ACI86H_001574, partial [bacterium]
MKKNLFSSKSFHSDQGSCQSERLPSSLNKNYLKLEERSVSELLTQGVGFAKQIKFITENNTIAGNWADLLVYDESILIALIQQESIQKHKDNFLYTLRTQSEEPQQHLLELIRLYLNLVQKIDTWFRLMKHKGMFGSQPLPLKLTEVINHQKENLVILQEFTKLCFEQEFESDSKINQYITDNLDFKVLGEWWGVYSSSSVEEVVDEEFIEYAFFSLLKSLTHLQDFAKKHFDSSLHSGNHDPANALLIGFIKLLHQVQRKTDHFLEQHQQFYYQELLKIDLKKTQPDQTTLILSGTPSETNTFIQKGTAFLAEKTDIHDELIYKADTSLKMVDAQVVQLANLYLQQDPLDVPGFGAGIVSNI